MSSNKYYYYLKSELNSIKFTLIVIILLFIYLFFFFFCKKIFSIIHLRAWLKVFFLGDRQQPGVDSGFTQQIVSIRVRHLVIQNIMVDPWQCHGMLRGKSLNSSCHLQGCQLNP